MNATINLVIGGSYGSGKSSLVERLIYNTFNHDHPMTIGVNFDLIKFEKGNDYIKLHIWDCGGNDRFRFLVPNYVKDAKGGLIVFDLASDSNYQTVINEWIEIFQKQRDVNLPIIFIGNKVDLVDENYNSEQRYKINQYASKMDSVYIETSAKTGYNVDECFHKLIDKILSQFKPETYNLTKHQPMQKVSSLNALINEDYIFFVNIQKEQAISLVKIGQFDLAYNLISSTKARFHGKGLTSLEEMLNSLEKEIDIKKNKILLSNKKKIHSLFLKGNLRCTLHREVNNATCLELREIKKYIQTPEIFGFFMYEFPKENNELYDFENYKNEIKKIMELINQVNNSTMFNIKIPREAIWGDNVKTCDFCRISRSYDFGMLLLSPPNPNAYLEAGLFLSLGKKVFLLNNETILKNTPFDLTPFFYIHYNNIKELEENWNKKFLPILTEFENLYLNINKRKRILQRLFTPLNKI